jgi:hypothetical protein
VALGRQARLVHRGQVRQLHTGVSETLQSAVRQGSRSGLPAACTGVGQTQTGDRVWDSRATRGHRWNALAS